MNNVSNAVVDVYAELRKHIRNALSEMHGVSLDRNGFYYSECYKDYDDELSDGDIADILAGRRKISFNGQTKVVEDEPIGIFEDMLQEAYGEEMFRIESELSDSLFQNAAVAEFIEKHGISEDVLRDCLRDVWYVNPPCDDYLRQEVCMDIMLDTGDANYEFTLNNLASVNIESVEDFDSNSSLLWLCEQQGVTKEELLNAFDKGSAHSDEVRELFARRTELTEALKQYGFKTPRFNESVIHTGAYREYVQLQNTVTENQARLSTLRSQYATTDISYDVYLKKHFDSYARLDPLTEEQFTAKRDEALGKISKRINEVETILSNAQEKLSSKVDYAEVARLTSEYKDVQRQLHDLASTEAYKKAAFINSVHNEILNTYGSSVVTFLVKMPLEEAIRLQDVIIGESEINNSYYYEERKGLSSIVLDKDVCCGLMDDCSGKGSVFEIKLIKDVEIPIKALYKAVPDRENGNYGFMEIYGANDESFSESLKAIHEVVKPRINDLIADAAKISEETNNDVVSKDSGVIAKEEHRYGKD